MSVIIKISTNSRMFVLGPTSEVEAREWLEKNQMLPASPPNSTTKCPLQWRQKEGQFTIKHRIGDDELTEEIDPTEFITVEEIKPLHQCSIRRK